MSSPPDCLPCPQCATPLPATGTCARCALGLALETSPQIPSPKIPTHIGSYRVLSEIGRGGMGTVYLAEQDKPVSRKIAIKRLHPHASSVELLRRFSAERQALAQLDHPAIARYLDAGADEEGFPYVVIEYFPGIPVTRYCKEHGLSLSDRLHLFATLADAVFHAHQRGIIHRDLKPSNVLAAPPGELRIIDFGIAKTTGPPLVDAILATVTGHFLGTPTYASPEQFLGKPIDTRSDIYSLGLILYEILAGQPPYDPATLAAATPAHLQQLLTEEDPPPPSIAASAANHNTPIPKDLDWITRRALEKSPSARYSTAADLAEDIRRHLQHQPVRARSHTLRYRTAKYLRRHRYPLAAASAIVATLAAGIITTSTQAHRARASAASMEVQKNRADDLIGFMLETHFKRLDKDSDLQLKVDTARRIIADLETLPTDQLSPENSRRLGEAYWEAGAVLVAAGEWDDAQGAFDLGANLWKKISAGEPNDLNALYKYGLNTNGRGWTQEKSGNQEAARKSYTNAVSILENVQQRAATHPDPPNIVWALKLRTAYTNLSRTLSESDPTHAIEISDKGIALIKKLLSAAPGDLNLKQALHGSLEAHSGALLKTDPSQSIIYAQEAVSLTREIFATRGNDIKYSTGIAVALSYLSDAHAANQDLAAAIAAREKMAAIYRTYNTSKTSQTTIRELLAAQLGRLAQYYTLIDQPKKAQPLLNEACTLMENLIDRLGEKAPQAWHTTLSELQAQLTSTTDQITARTPPVP